jgi:hypothetical protein
MAAVAAVYSPTRREVQTRVRLSFSAAVVWMCGVFLSVGAFAHSASRPTLVTAAITLGLCALATTSTAVVLARGATPIGRSQSTLALTTALIPFAVLGWLASWQPAAAHADVPAGWRCGGLTVSMGVALLAAMMIANRRSDAIHPRSLGAAFGAIAGAWGAVFAAAWCPLFDLPHTLFGHVVPVLLLTVVGALTARLLAARSPSIDAPRSTPAA